MDSLRNESDAGSESDPLLESDKSDSENHENGPKDSVTSSLETTRVPEKAPVDRWNVVYLIFYLMGIGSLLPWNFFSNAKMYFLYKLRNISDTNPHHWNNTKHYTDLQVMFESYLTLAAMLPNVLFMFLNTAATKYISLRVRIVVATSAMILMFILTIILTKVNTDEWQHLFFIITIVSIIIMNAGSAVLQGGVFGLSGMFPEKYSQSVMGGMGLGGLTAAVASVITVAIGSDPIESGFGYFITAEIVVIAALIGFLCLPCNKFARYYSEMKPRPRSPSINYFEQRVDADESAVDISMEISYGESGSLWRVFKKLKLPGFCVFFSFTLTLSCYPAINSAIQAQYSDVKHPSVWAGMYFMPVSCFLAFNTFDLLGRTLAGPLQFPRQGSPIMLLLCLMRVLIVPIFLFCNVQPRHNLPVIFHQDWIPIVSMAVFAISNGYLGTLCMMYGPQAASGENLELAGAMMSFLLSLGLGVGAVCSLLLVKLV
ncbi:hypothetical protein CAPTEDRAFT_221180 [Capitella teleta]|uniref:Equilibrative nucleoside transporter 3 n=1 Tax=Capitella teleta TaxID=283909 RepID=R7TAV9_CAPTE|nr:hypothetical protein CAPTEDRAFT_221180 [Capitella teleta]|eukprot:ELT88134.1 hypothetical protein CAPTEDRAFT_221180 [Capitella teleta]